MPGVAAHRRLRAAGRGRFHPRPEQQETRTTQRRSGHRSPSGSRPDRNSPAMYLPVVYAAWVADHEKRCDGADTGQRRDPVRPGDLFESALAAVVSAWVIRCVPAAVRRDQHAGGCLEPRSGCRLISTPEIRVRSSAFNVSRDNFAGSSTSEKSGLMVMWPKSLRCKPPSLAMAPTIAPGPILCRLPTAMRYVANPFLGPSPALRVGLAGRSGRCFGTAVGRWLR